MLEERLAAYHALLKFKKSGAFLHELPPFATELATGVCRRMRLLDYAVRKNVKRLPRPEVLTILEMGAYQIFFMDGVKDHAAVHTSAELARTLKLGEGAVAFVNGVLRGLLRNGLPALPKGKLERASLEFSVPETLLRRWAKELGEETALEVAARHIERPVWWLRVNLKASTPEELSEAFGLPCEVLASRYLKVPAGASLKALLASKEFSEGKFTVQNPAAGAVLGLLNLASGLSVWDACAAPGGKTSLMAEEFPGAKILASDVSAPRLDPMKKQFEKFAFPNVELAVLDAAHEIPEAAFDRILLDVPCSNLGVLDKRPEAVYRASDEAFASLSLLQFAILENASRALKPGGILVYATCSPEPSETLQVVKKFLAKHGEFKAEGAPLYTGSGAAGIDNFFAQALTNS